MEGGPLGHPRIYEFRSRTADFLYVLWHKISKRRLSLNKYQDNHIKSMENRKDVIILDEIPQDEHVSNTRKEFQNIVA